MEMAIRDQGRKLGLDISRAYTYYDSNVIGHHRKVLLPDEGSNNVSKPDLDNDSKPNIDITQCAKYLLNDPLNPNSPSSNFSCKYYGTPKTLPKDMKESQPGGISRKEVNIPEEYRLTSLQKEHYSKKQKVQLFNNIPLIFGTIIYIGLSMYKQVPSAYVIIPTHEGYILPLQLLIGLPYKPMWIYPPEG